ncbi:hypothetical protein BaRGS_00039345 [Batillaria attramentaria]|uniref:MICOS complex subunit n=1 Tax=Batillaria attramentaria TaxID=370345 RepID=A0ABD0J3M2_9CAEN
MTQSGCAVDVRQNHGDQEQNGTQQILQPQRTTKLTGHLERIRGIGVFHPFADSHLPEATQHLLRIGAGALFASVPLVPAYTVYASDGSEDEDKPKVRITELSIYDNPETRNRYRYVQEEINPLRQVVSQGRQALWAYLETVQESYVTGVIDYIQNDPGMLPRVVVITIAGLGGVVAGYRGRLEVQHGKRFYSAAAITAAASLCYPNQAVELSNDVYKYCKDQFHARWPMQEFREGPTKSPEARKVMMDPGLPAPTPGMPPIKGDPGMSLEEDEDMYTTRGAK